MAREALITKEGLDKLKTEIEHLQTVKRREVAERIKDAREFGDISENSEYDDAKNEQAIVEQRIAQLEERLRRAELIDEKKIDTEVVGVGVRVHVKDQKSGESRKFHIVGADRGESGRGKAFQRVSDRARADGAQAWRGRGRRCPSRPEEEVQDHQDRVGVAGL